MGKPDFVFRTYRKGDEEGIAHCLTTCFKTFADFGMTGDKWLKIPEYDPGFEYKTALVAEKDGQIVGPPSINIPRNKDRRQHFCSDRRHSQCFNSF